MASSAGTEDRGTVGFIGVGIMGLGMCHNLLKSGRSLVVWNRSREAADALAAEPASAGRVTVADTPAAVVAACDLTYSMLSTLDASVAVFPVIIDALRSGKKLVDCATLTVERMQAMAAVVRGRGAAFLEAPVSGSKAPAEQGQLIFLVAGDQAAFDAARDDMSAMGKKTCYFGEVVGKGTEMKLVVNMIMCVQLNAVAEGFNLASACGLDVNELAEVLNNGAMASPMVKGKLPMMAANNFAPQFPLKHAQKDLRFAVALADAHDVAVPVAAASNEQFKSIRARDGDLDFSAIVRASAPTIDTQKP